MSSFSKFVVKFYKKSFDKFFISSYQNVCILPCNDLTSQVSTGLSNHGCMLTMPDMLFKPEERILFRPANFGGLGMQNVNYNTLAGLIRSFLETACNPDFRHSLFHEILFKYIFSFLETIKKVHNKSP